MKPNDEEENEYQTDLIGLRVLRDRISHLKDELVQAEIMLEKAMHNFDSKWSDRT